MKIMDPADAKKGNVRFDIKVKGKKYIIHMQKFTYRHASKKKWNW